MPQMDAEQRQANKLVLTGTVTFAVCAVLLLGMLVKVGFEIHEYRTAAQSASWPSVQGEVLESKVIRKKLVRSESSGSQGPGHGTSTSSSRVEWGYKPAVRYRYHVSGKAYTGDRIELSLDWSKHDSGRRRVEQRLHRYPARGTVTVYYNPDQPGESLLVKGVTGDRQTELWIFSGIAGLFLIGTIIGFWLRVRGKRRGGFIEPDEY